MALTPREGGAAPRLALKCLRAVAAGLAAASLAGCVSLAPQHETPPLPVPNTYPADGRTSVASAVNAHGLPWNEYFTDPALQRLIEAALANNRDLRTAALRVDEARAAFRIQRADRFPGIDVGAQGARARTPGDLNVSGDSVVGGEYRAEVGLSTWELDLWGRVRSLETSALQAWLATDAARQAVRVALIAQVADGYLGLRELDERVAIARQTVASREESYRIFRRRFEVGATSKLELVQVQTLLTQAQSLHAQLAQARASQFHALVQLVGNDLGPLPQAPLTETAALADLQPGLPSELLANRPDILSAEHRLRAAHADIGAARAAFFPRIALTGTWGTASAELDGLFDSGSRAWTFVPTLSLPLFDGGRRRAGLDLAEVRRDIAVAGYEQTIQTAFREVADALSARRWLAEQLDIQRVALDAQAERARLAQLRYDNGSAAYLEVLDAQRDLLDAAQQLVQVRRTLLSSRVALYAALGGGAGLPPAPSASTR
ncbi:efflux transporter outer membrane subunit [Pseudothauera rhizosphaerae]|uniref:Efflux transporter outer membrane subunit n=1 Tax=Pseudothauera rhizosphaerae TaxID=2565932 RepID=A0A4V3WB33_9RHOO|nr:efflux transporter outer membrane subunit [Pseudothauera rhizosphaerae]THF61700.1 efflux transporter outer membrane subunit [Pseudothauera rhizosphaerae]